MVVAVGHALNCEQPTDSGTPVGEIAAQCLCGIGVLPGIDYSVSSSRIAFVPFEIRKIPFLRLSLPDTLFEPPRA